VVSFWFLLLLLLAVICPESLVRNMAGSAQPQGSAGAELSGWAFWSEKEGYGLLIFVLSKSSAAVREAKLQLPIN
jgi:hypothetical protein